MTETEIDYEGLAQEALRGVVRTVLARVAQGDKLPGNHHFYISFNTNGEGVSVSKRLREQYPEEMTIVLQHRYWDLQVHDDRFEVKLTFNSIPERLVVPYTAIKVFFDPSVPYGLQFENAGQMSADTLPPVDTAPRLHPAPKAGSQKRSRPSHLKDLGRDRPASQLTETPRPKRAVEPGAKRSSPGDVPQLASSIAPVPPADAGAGPASPEAKPPGQVVRLDAFRKK
jgi:uncharacterized protein